ncbi:hypothetical protein IWQ60_001594 [Tieghemiomyces parasiticus]|uniref:Uncharacterized protein n=1 Tax=Tieghemiomyces parasiticus TaxID=78921 RepID=A0A9W8DY63_9FUNG|nr:hypothetical protein IWQ60_001594 [Tieghemiomyces parasiticus]
MRQLLNLYRNAAERAQTAYGLFAEEREDEAIRQLQLASKSIAVLLNLYEEIGAISETSTPNTIIGAPTLPGAPLTTTTTSDGRRWPGKRKSDPDVADPPASGATKKSKAGSTAAAGFKPASTPATNGASALHGLNVNGLSNGHGSDPAGEANTNAAASMASMMAVNDMRQKQRQRQQQQQQQQQHQHHQQQQQQQQPPPPLPPPQHHQPQAAPTPQPPTNSHHHQQQHLASQQQLPPPPTQQQQHRAQYPHALPAHPHAHGQASGTMAQPYNPTVDRSHLHLPNGSANPHMNLNGYTLPTAMPPKAAHHMEPAAAAHGTPTDTPSGQAESPVEHGESHATPRPRGRAARSSPGAVKDSPSSSGVGSTRQPQLMAPLPPEQEQRLSEVFFSFLQRICSDLGATDSRGETIHQTLMAKKMLKLEQTTDFRPFRFRIMSFTNAFHEEVRRLGIDEDGIPTRHVKQFLQTHPYISRFNDDGNKSKSKGNHVLNVEARKMPTGCWEFKEFKRYIMPPHPKPAVIGMQFEWTPKIWDPQLQAPKAFIQSPWLPNWLKWEDNVLRGVPGIDAQSFDLKVNVAYLESSGQYVHRFDETVYIQVTTMDSVNMGVSMDAFQLG